MAILPTNDEVERVILDEIQKYNVRVGEIFPIAQVISNAQTKNVSFEEVVSALERMVEKAWFEPMNGPHWRLLEGGFEAL